MIDIDELDRPHAAATRAPWTREKPKRDADGWSMGVAVAGTPGQQTIYAHPPGGSFPSADCDLIVALRNAAPAILRELRALRELQLASQHYWDDDYEDAPQAIMRVRSALAAAKAAREVRDDTK